MAKFLNGTKPLLVGMVQEKTAEDAILVILDSLADGADAIGVQLECLEKASRTPDKLKKIFSACDGKPIYITSYRNHESAGMTDDECANLLLEGLEAGADLGDVMGDLYAPTANQMTFDPAAVEKQIALIEKIHRMGKEVLISSHLHAFYPEKELLRFGKEQIRRGADIVKLVGRTDNRAELIATINAAEEMKNTLTKPFLLLANGPHSRLLREIGPAFGVSMYLCVDRHRPTNTKEQPLLRKARAIRDNLF